MRHFHYEIHGFNKRFAPEGSTIKTGILDFTPIDVVAKNEEEALSLAKTLVKKRYYRIGRVYECHAALIDTVTMERMPN